MLFQSKMELVNEIDGVFLFGQAEQDVHENKTKKKKKKDKHTLLKTEMLLIF